MELTGFLQTHTFSFSWLAQTVNGG